MIILFTSHSLMFGFKKHCPMCGIDVEKESGIVKFGKFFCCTSHAEQYGGRESASQLLRKR